MKRNWKLALLALVMTMSTAFAFACDKDKGDGGTGGGTNVDQTPTKLQKISVSLDGTLASWTAVDNASGYEYSFDNGATFTFTTATSVQLQAGQSLVVRAAGDGVNYRHGDWSDPITLSPDQGGDVGGGDSGCTTCVDNDNNHLCDSCGEPTSVCADANNDHDCDICGDEMSVCKDDNNDHDCDICGDEMSVCKDDNNDHDCDICGEKISECKDDNNDHVCDVCEETISQCADVNNDNTCDTCGEWIKTDTTGDVLFTGKKISTVKKYSGEEAEVVSTPASGIKMTSQNSWERIGITLTKNGMPLTVADLSEYRYLEIKVYAEQSNTRLFFYSQQMDTLTQGENTVKLSTWDMLYQMKTGADAYDETTGEAYFQLWDGGHTIILESITGVVEAKEEVPNGDVGEVNSSYELNACEGNSESNPISWYCTTNGSASEDTTFFKTGTASYKVVVSANNYITLSLRHSTTAPLTKAELLAFDFLCLDVYNGGESDVNLFLYNALAATLAPGWNEVKIPRATIAAQIEESETAGGVQQFDAGGHFFFVVYADATLYFDNVRGTNEGVVELGNVFILGDSYSTFEEYIPYGSGAAWYQYVPDFDTNVDNPSETWWWKTIAETNSTLLLNASYSGTTICNTGYSGELGGAKSNSFTTRLQEYIDEGYFEENQVDTFFLFGGTNDIWANHTNGHDIGSPKYSGWTEDDLNYILPAFCYLLNQIKTNVNPTNLVFILNDDLVNYDPNAVEKYKEICAYYGVDVVELTGIGKTSGHPNEVGMTAIKDQIIQHFKSK